MNLKNIRWKQRFENLEKAFTQLSNAVQIDKLSDLERSGLIQTFEFSFELAWKTLKDFLESEGLEATSPRQVIQLSFQSGFIKNGHDWIDALEKRNLLAHTYSQEYSIKAESLIKEKYFPFLEEMISSFKQK